MLTVMTTNVWWPAHTFITLIPLSSVYPVLRFPSAARIAPQQPRAYSVMLDLYYLAKSVYPKSPKAI